MFKRFCMIIGMVLLFVTPAAADRLSDLLDGLAKARSASEAEKMVDEIWPLWLYPETASDQKDKMDQGLSAMRHNNFAKADRLFSEIIDENPDYTEAWNKRATVRFMAGDFVGSEADILQTLTREPRHFGAISGLGLINMHLNEYEKALNSFKMLRRLNPYSKDAKEFIPILNELLGRRDL